MAATTNNVNVNANLTNAKLDILAITNKPAADYARSLLAVQKSANTSTATTPVTSSIDRYTKNLVQTIFQAEVKTATTVSNSVNNITTGIQNVTNSITGALTQNSKDINEALKPVSSVTGSTLGTITHCLKDPLGAPAYLANSIAELYKKADPEGYERIEATYKKYKNDSLAHLPDQIMGSVKSIVNALDAILSLPAALISDLYNGLQAIMQQIASSIDQIEAAIQKFFFGPGGLLDNIAPGLTDFLAAVQEFAGYITGITQTFAGATQIANIAIQSSALAGQLNGFISNPLNLAFAYAPPVVSQGLYAINNPVNIINQYLPPQISQGFATISKMTGVGFNGNMGYGLQSVLQGLQGGVISSVVSNYAKQYAMLGHLVTLAPGVKTATVATNLTQPLNTVPSPVNPNILTANSIPYVDPSTSTPVFQYKTPTPTVGPLK